MYTGSGKPVIGIPLWIQEDHLPDYPDKPVKRVLVNHAYVDAIDKNGGIPLLLSPMARGSIDEQLSLCSGLLLPGGFDVDPRMYLEERLPECADLRGDIDEEWYIILSAAIRRSLPVFGICRGMQYMNIYFGGSMYQDIHYQEKALGRDALKHAQKGSRTVTTHVVEVKKDSLLAQCLGTWGEVAVNSMHHQSIKTLGNGFSVCAQAEDGTIEAIENREKMLLGVQWHPEELTETSPMMNGFFRALLAMCRNNAEAVKPGEAAGYI